MDIDRRQPGLDQKHCLARGPVTSRRSDRASGQGRPSSEEDAEASYDYLRRIKYFEPSSKVSRTKLRNLVAMEQRAGTVNPAFAIDRLVMPSLTELTD